MRWTNHNDMHSKTLSADVASTAAAVAATDVVASIVPSGIGKPRERAKAKASSAQFSSEGGHHHRHTANKCRVKSKVANEGRLASDGSLSVSIWHSRTTLQRQHTIQLNTGSVRWTVRSPRTGHVSEKREIGQRAKPSYQE